MDETKRGIEVDKNLWKLAVDAAINIAEDEDSFLCDMPLHLESLNVLGHEVLRLRTRLELAERVIDAAENWKIWQEKLHNIDRGFEINLKKALEAWEV